MHWHWFEIFTYNWLQICGEILDVPTENVDAFRENFHQWHAQYALEDIFNADESALYYSALPNKTLDKSHVNATGRKMSKARVTLLLCCNAAGEKFPPLIIGKYSNPRCFRGIDRKLLPCPYKSTKNAWMNTNIFREWLCEVNRRMIIQKRSILLILDNAPSHRFDNSLSNIKVVYLPPNCTSVLQPLDQGIIWSFKCSYRKALLEYLIDGVDNECHGNMLKDYDLFKALHFVRRAWAEVQVDVIKNCFQKSGLFNRINDKLPNSPTDADSSDFAKLDDELFSLELKEIDIDTDEVSHHLSIQ